MTREADKPVGERLLTVSEVTAILSTSERFPRRLIAERRIRFVTPCPHPRVRAARVHRGGAHRTHHHQE